MTEDSRLGSAHEYDTLRHELLEAKRYVFERPLAITALAAIGMQAVGKPQFIALPIAISFVTLFNFWFTVNRVQSASRIVAYIQLVLEPSASLPWTGWESSLRQYRKWIGDRGKRAAAKFVDEDPELKAANPDALMYYPAVYRFHIALMASAALAGLTQFEHNAANWSQALSLIPASLGVWSTFYFWCWRPGRLRFSIERNRVIWKAALRHITPDAHELPIE